MDYDLQFEKSFVEPLKIILDSIGWSVEKTVNLELFLPDDLPINDQELSTIVGARRICALVEEWICYQKYIIKDNFFPKIIKEIREETNHPSGYLARDHNQGRTLHKKLHADPSLVKKADWIYLISSVIFPEMDFH